MSDERDGAGSAGDGTDTEATGETRGQTAVVTQPVRPTGKRSRRGAVGRADADDTDTTAETEAGVTKNGAGKKPKTANKSSGPSRKPLIYPFVYVWTYLKEVVAELRKVIWPNRKQMISFTSVVLVFLAFMVTLIGLVDVGLAKLVLLVFG